jgi:hypothetical protein
MFSYMVEIRRLAPSSAEEGYPEKESIVEIGLLVDESVRHRYCTSSTTSLSVLEGDGAPRNTMYLMDNGMGQVVRLREEKMNRIRQRGLVNGNRALVDLNGANALYLSV